MIVWVRNSSGPQNPRPDRSSVTSRLARRRPGRETRCIWRRFHCPGRRDCFRQHDRHGGSAHPDARACRAPARSRRFSHARGATSATKSHRSSAQRRGSSSSAPRRATSESATYAAHVNGLRPRAARPRCGWHGAARRSRSIPRCSTISSEAASLAGQSVASTVAKEAWEEAGIPARLVEDAQPAGVVHLCREQPDGLQRETIFVHDLWLPWTISRRRAGDGEVVGPPSCDTGGSRAR